MAAATTASEVTLIIVLAISVNLSIVNNRAKPAISCSGVKPIPLSTKTIVIKPVPGMPAQVLDAIMVKIQI